MKKLLPLLILSFLSLTSKSQWTADTVVNTLVRDSAGSTFPRMATAQNGYTYVSWFETDIFANFTLRMQLLDVNGNYVWAPEGLLIDSHPQNANLLRYDLKTDKDGNAIVALQDLHSGKLDIILYKLNQASQFIWGGDGISLTDSSCENGSLPSLAISDLGDVYVAWTADSASNQWVVCRRISSAGGVQWNTNYIVRDPQRIINYTRPMLSPNSTGGVQLLYVQESASGPQDSSYLFVQQLDSTGNTLWPADVQLSTQNVLRSFIAQPVNDLHGGMFVAFNSNNPSDTSYRDVFVQHIDSAGNLWNTLGIQADHSVTEHKMLGGSVYASSSNEFWISLRILDQAQTISGISVQRFDSTGNPVYGTSAFNLVVPDFDFHTPHTCTDVNDGIIFSETYGQGIDFLRAWKINYTGHVVWAILPVSLSVSHSFRDEISSGEFKMGNLVFVWHDDRNASSAVYAQNITADGKLGSSATNIPNEQADSPMLLFPNPDASPLIYLPPGESTVTILDLKGQKIFSKKIIDPIYRITELSEISEGLYLVNIVNENYNRTVKWSKVR